MLTTTREGTSIVLSRPYTTVLGRLLVVALILTPLVAMLFPELKHRSGNRTSAGVQAAPAAQSQAKDPLSTPFSLDRSGR
jgi:hypothetical protein